MTIGRTGSKPYLVLKDYRGSSDYLVTIKTGGRHKREITKVIKTNIASWMKNPEFEHIREKPLDLAIVARIDPMRMKTQDIDNIAKVVLDALKETEGDSRFLFHDDSQIVRLLIWKIQREECQGYITDSLTISFRIHDSEKQMVLIRPRII